MNKKRLFYILGAVAFLLFGVLNFVVNLVWGGGNGFENLKNLVVGVFCLIAFVLFMVKAFVEKMPRQVLIVPFAMLGLVAIISFFSYIINWFQIFIHYGLDDFDLFINLFINLIYYVLTIGTSAFAIVYICLKDKMKKLFFLPCVLLAISGGISFVWNIFTFVINWGLAPGYLIQRSVIFIISLLQVVAYFFVCFAVSKEEKPQAVVITAEGENVDVNAQTTEAYTSGATVNTAPAPAAASQATEKEPEGYENLAIFLLLYFLTGGIWLYVWIYKQTKFLNADKTEAPRDPVLQTLLCVFVPYYWIYWTYKSAERIDRLAKARGISSDLKVLCTVLCFVVTIVPPILMILKVNEIVKTPEPVAQSTPVFVYGQSATQTAPVTPVSATAVNAASVSEELKKYKELLDSGAITQEEYDAVKKRLLGL